MGPKWNFTFKSLDLSVRSQFKKSKSADRGHSLNRDFTVFHLITDCYIGPTKTVFRCQFANFNIHLKNNCQMVTTTTMKQFNECSLLIEDFIYFAPRTCDHSLTCTLAAGKNVRTECDTQTEDRMDRIYFLDSFIFQLRQIHSLLIPRYDLIGTANGEQSLFRLEKNAAKKNGATFVVPQVDRNEKKGSRKRGPRRRHRQTTPVYAGCFDSIVSETNFSAPPFTVRKSAMMMMVIMMMMMMKTAQAR